MAAQSECQVRVDEGSGFWCHISHLLSSGPLHPREATHLGPPAIEEGEGESPKTQARESLHFEEFESMCNDLRT